MTKLSVIIPVYNVETYLHECLSSIVNQTYKDLEIICINDGSTDNSLKILEEYAKHDNRVRIISQENKGQSSARNTGLLESTGKYITFVDSDDILDLNAYKKALSKMQDVDICCFGTEIFGNSSYEKRKSDESYYEIKYSGKTILNDKIKLKTNCSVCNKIFKKEIIDKFDIKFPNGLHYEDAEFYLKYIINCNKAFFIKDKFYKYRRRENSIMHQTFNGCNFAIEHLYIVKNLFYFLNKINQFEENINLFSSIFKMYFSFTFSFSKPIEYTNILNIGTSYAKDFYKNRKAKNNFVKNILECRYENIFDPDVNFIQKIFSIKKSFNPIYRCNRKIIYILGLKIRTKIENKNIIATLNKIEDSIEILCKKLES